ncbi:hypothetical protein HK104_002580, partial [Borealophlyctis nickersoniae]
MYTATDTGETYYVVQQQLTDVATEGGEFMGTAATSASGDTGAGGQQQQQQQQQPEGNGFDVDMSETGQTYETAGGANNGDGGGDGNGADGFALKMEFTGEEGYALDALMREGDGGGVQGGMVGDPTVAQGVVGVASGEGEVGEGGGLRAASSTAAEMGSQHLVVATNQESWAVTAAGNVTHTMANSNGDASSDPAFDVFNDQGYNNFPADHNHAQSETSNSLYNSSTATTHSDSYSIFWPPTDLRPLPT